MRRAHRAGRAIGRGALRGLRAHDGKHAGSRRCKRRLKGRRCAIDDGRDGPEMVGPSAADSGEGRCARLVSRARGGASKGVPMQDRHGKTEFGACGQGDRRGRQAGGESDQLIAKIAMRMRRLVALGFLSCFDQIGRAHV